MSWSETILLMASLTLVIAAIEARADPAPTDWRRNLQAWVVNASFGALIALFVPAWTGGSVLDLAHRPFWMALIVFTLLADFLEFAFHVAQHRVPFLWRMHSLHHSDPEMSTLTTNRHFWGDQLIKGLTIWPLLAVLAGPSPAHVLIFNAISFYNFVIHAKLKIDFGRWSWMLNCPAYHRQHHSRLMEHHNTNFAALFPIWDVLFGTYRRPNGWPPCGLPDEAPQSVQDIVFWPVRNWHRRPSPDPLP